EIVSQRLLFTDDERPLIAQIWGKDPQHFYQAAQKLVTMGFDGIDINMGCPEKSIIQHGCCAALIENRPLASEIIRATQEGAGNLPVSVKTRIGIDAIVTEDWISFLLSHDLAALTVHGRTVRELSQVPAHWDEIGKAVKIRDAMKKSTAIIGNGDIISKEDAKQKYEEYGVDGIMIGRGIFKNPFVFGKAETWLTMSMRSRLNLLQKHLNLFHDVWGNKKNFAVMKKYIKIYVADLPQASEIREKLMTYQNYEEMYQMIANLLRSAE
ncbi:MAG: tRNA-dihydrouridine synthase, partial [Patescibacteria group bacterium]|nr:tRNA-dihydrouridine synthase [Patescibacteria group bacterium]